MDRPSVESQQASIDRLRREIAELRASRKRIVLAADAERRALERALHESVHQQLIALAVNMQLAVEAADADPTAAKTLLEAMGGDVKSALDDTAKLAQRMYPPLLDGGGLAAALRTEAARLGVRVSVDVAARPNCPRAAVSTVYLFCRALLEDAGDGARATISVRETPKALEFDMVADGAGPGSLPDRVRDRVEALGGRLSARPARGRGTHVSGSLPLSE